MAASSATRGYSTHDSTQALNLGEQLREAVLQNQIDETLCLLKRETVSLLVGISDLHIQAILRAHVVQLLLDTSDAECFD